MSKRCLTDTFRGTHSFKYILLKHCFAFLLQPVTSWTPRSMTSSKISLLGMMSLFTVDAGLHGATNGVQLSTHKLFYCSNLSVGTEKQFNEKHTCSIVYSSRLHFTVGLERMNTFIVNSRDSDNELFALQNTLKGLSVRMRQRHITLTV